MDMLMVKRLSLLEMDMVNHIYIYIYAQSSISFQTFSYRHLELS